MALSRLVEHYRRGEFASVLDAAEQFAGPREARAAALRLAGQSAGKLARYELAATYFLRAVELMSTASNSHAECLANAGIMLARAGHPAMAALAWLCDLRETALRPAHDVSVRQLTHYFAAQPEARLTCLAVAVRSPDHFHTFFPAFVDLLSTATAPSAPRSVLAPAVRGLISVVVCSRRDERFARFERECAPAFPGDDVEILRVADARYMGDGYRRGMARARCEWLLFMHDDVELLSPDFGQRVRQSFSSADVFFPVGSASLAGPAWFSAGAQHLRGSVTLPGSSKDVVDVAWCGAAQTAEPMAIGDGFLIGARRDVAEQVGWDEDPADAFHGYDLSFTSRATRSGARVRAATRLQVLHHSVGDFDVDWLNVAQRVCDRVSIPRGPATSPRWVRRDDLSRAAAITLFDRVADWQAVASAALDDLVIQQAEVCAVASDKTEAAKQSPLQWLRALALPQ